LVIRWFRWIVTTSTPGDPTGSGRGFGTQRDPARLVFFSDAVFAIAVTLLVLEIRPPQDTRHLLHGLAALWPSYLAYAITFLLIGQVWANHHVMFDHICSADRMVLFLNTLLLMDIAFLPFAAAVLSAAFGTGHGQRTTVVCYGLAFGWRPCCSTPSGATRAMIGGCLAPPSMPRGPAPSAGVSGSPWPGSRLGPYWAPCSPCSAWP
jgi:Endosomal/lysosomal potassium channel TMEM175